MNDYTRNLWNAHDASGYLTDLEQCVYASRLLGQDPALVLHGGGNTSVKTTGLDLLGREQELLYVKGSGWDLKTIEPAGFAPLRLHPLQELAELTELSDTQMVNELRANLVDTWAPGPSVETILHAVLPFKYVFHTHADAVVAVTNTPSGRQHVEQIYGGQVVIVPYVMPGFALARACKEHFEAQATEETKGLLLLNHGVFSFADEAKDAYEVMIELVNRAEQFLTERGAWHIPTSNTAPGDAVERRTELSQLRAALSEAAGRPLIVCTSNDSETRSFIDRSDLDIVSQQGPATPDHVIRTKRLPLIGRDVDGYKTSYEEYFKRNAPAELTMLDPAPRVILEPQLGLLSVGSTVSDAQVVEDIYRHTIRIITRAQQLERYRALPEESIFEVEYWELEQAKLAKAGGSPAFQGEVALVTGAASGIGKAACAALLERGAAVVGLDLSAEVTGVFDTASFVGIACDVTDEAALESALERAARNFGGLDMLVLNAGVFPSSAEIAVLDHSVWDKTLRTNVTANFHLMQLAKPLLVHSPRGGRVVAVGSKNVAAPGPGQAAYSASKAALNQLMRVAAHEWGKHGIRVYTVHPNAVFDTSIWTDEVLAARAKHYDQSVEDYKTNNLLGVSISSQDVGELISELCGPRFAKVTGAQIPIDGGNERII